MFDKICRHNAITHRLTAPESPNQNGKVERFHGTFRPDFLAVAGPFESVAAAQAAVDAWVESYNVERPHQSLDERVPVVPADRFAATAASALPLWVPPSLDIAAPTTGPDETSATGLPVLRDGVRPVGSAAPIELDLPVPPSGNMCLRGQQFWLGPERAGQTVRFWVDCEWIHLSIGDRRLKSLRSPFTTADLDKLVATRGARPASGPPPTATRARERTGIVEVERVVARAGTISLGSRVVLVAWMLAGRRVGVWIEDDAPLLFFDPETRELLRSRPNPLEPDEAHTLQRQKPVGTPPRPSTEPITVQRRASNTGTVMVAGQKVALGRGMTHQTVTIHVAEATLAIELPDGETKIVRRTTDQAVRNIKGRRPRTADTSVS